MGTRFQWSQVDGRVVRRFLTECEPETFAKRKVDRMSEHEVRTAAHRFGEPPRPEFTDELVDVALSVWLPLASSATVEALATYIQQSISGPARTQVLRTKPERIDFIRARNRTKLLKLNVRRHFLSAHKVADGQPRKPNRPKDGRALLSPVRLIGGGLPSRPLHRHQREAVAGLDRLVLERHGLASGVLVLPTGAGKTEAMASWLLDRMDDDPAPRVLWVAGQQELLRQAASRFETLAASKPRGFERLGREIHGGGYRTSLLANPEMDVAFVTIQSLRSDVIRGPKSSLRQFLRRENIVVIDEAHHAAAPSYTKLFEELGVADTTIAVIGLTATPFPTSLASRFRFRERFPNEVHRVTAEELMLEKILARPVLHVVETHERIALNPAELDLAEANDLPPSVLKRLDSEARNRSVVSTYLKNSRAWGKTLIFATTIDHADRLHQLLVEEGVSASVMHSRMELDRADVLDHFRRATGAAVLVSVGMITEGVDLPDARTAFLGRPTTSRILLQQMIGRVLRGPRAGGEAEANVVYFSDVWSNFSEILEPPEALSGVRFEDPGSGPTSRRARKIDSLPELDPGAVGAIARRFDNLPEPGLTTCRLVGYYEILDQRQVPVFDHQLAPMRELLMNAMEGSLRGRALLSYFEEGPLPHPSARAMRDLVDFVREFEDLPPFTSLDQVVGPSIAADRILQSGPLDDAARAAIVRAVYDDTLANVTYSSFDRFEEAVDRELRERRSRRLNPESPRRGPEPRPRRRLKRFDRDLAPLTQRAIEACRTLLPSELTDRLFPPPVEWTRRVTSTSFAHWTLKPSGKNRGAQKIRVNRLLRCDPAAVPDEMLSYLIYHELLHHLLPGQSHDAEFRELEHCWPGAALLDAHFDSLHERWDTDPGRYQDDHA